MDSRINKPYKHKVSVILPNYNYARYLTERIDSILNQTLTDFELIILDDNSTDNSKDVIKKYESNPHVSRIIFNQENSGNTFSQWQKGIELAQGEYIWIAEADDIAEATLLEECINVMDDDPKIILCQVGCTIKERLLKHITEETNITNFLPYHFSQTCKILNRIVPYCLYPPKRKY